MAKSLLLPGEYTIAGAPLKRGIFLVRGVLTLVEPKEELE